MHMRHVSVSCAMCDVSFFYQIPNICKCVTSNFVSHVCAVCSLRSFHSSLYHLRTGAVFYLRSWPNLSVDKCENALRSTAISDDVATAVNHSGI